MHCIEGNSYLFLNGTETYKFKAKNSKIVANPLCLGNISKNWSVDKMKGTGFTDFSVDYYAIDADNIKDIHRYLMRKNNIVQYKMLRFIKKYFFIGSLFLSSLLSTTSLSCISMNNQACKVRPKIINVNSNEPVFYSFSIKTSKCGGSYNNINDPNAKCVFLML